MRTYKLRTHSGGVYEASAAEVAIIDLVLTFKDGRTMTVQVTPAALLLVDEFQDIKFSADAEGPEDVENK